MPSAALRQELHASLDFELETAAPLGLVPIGLPIRSDAIASRPVLKTSQRHWKVER
jgi:hypothetical protein